MLSITGKVEQVMMFFIAIFLFQQVLCEKCVGQTELIGGATLDQQEVEEFFAVDATDGDAYRLTQIQHCVESDTVDAHLRGFQATFTSMQTAEEQIFQYGGEDLAEHSPIDVSCITTQIPKEIELLKMIVSFDTNYLKGFRFIDQTSTIWAFGTFGGSESTEIQLSGPIVGFRVLTRRVSYSPGTQVQDRVPIYIQALYSTCTCAQSTFMGDAGPQDMQAEAVQGSPQEQFLTYQENAVSFYYGQSCGTYTIKISPDLPFLQLSSSGYAGPKGSPYTDTLTMLTTELSQIGIYDVTLTIEQDQANGDGFTEPQPGILPKIEYQLQLTVQPCRIGKFNVDAKPERLTYFIGDEPQTIGQYSFIEILSNCNYEAVIETDEPDWITHNSDAQDFTIGYFDDLSRAGIYNVIIKSTMTYPESATKDIMKKVSAQTSFEIELVDPCELTSLVNEWDIDPIVAFLNDKSRQIYIPSIGDTASAEFGNKDGFTFCGLRKYEIITVSSSYDNFMTFNGNQTFTIAAIRDQDVGSHEIIIRASFAKYPQVNALETVLTIIIESCDVDSVQALTEAQGLNYVIGEQEIVEVLPEWQQRNSVCDLSFQITRDDRPLTGYEKTMIRFTEANGLVEIKNVKDFRVAGKDWVLIITAESIESLLAQKRATVQLKITWMDPCYTSKLQAPYFDNSNSMTFELHHTLEITFFSMKDLTFGVKCGGYINNLKYVEGPLYDPNYVDGANLSELKFELVSRVNLELRTSGLITDPIWLGEHKIMIYSRNGRYNPSQSRGEKGIFGDITSEVQTFKVVDPCIDAQIFKVILDDMVSPDDVDMLESQIYDGLQNSIDQELCPNDSDDDCNICGGISYSILTEQKTPFDADWFQVDQLSEYRFKFTLRQNPAFTRVTQETFFVEAKLTEKPESKAVLLPITVSKRSCEPEDLRFELIDDQLIEVGEVPRSINIKVKQEPCDYKMNLSAFVIGGGESRQALPHLFVFDAQSSSIQIKTALIEERGEYKIVLVANLIEIEVSSEIQFTVTIFELFMPQWLEDLEDQFVAVGEAYFYVIGSKKDTLGRPLEITVNLGSASGFASYDSIQNNFMFDATLLTSKQIGTYEISISASIMSQAQHQQTSFTNSFTLTIFERQQQENGREEEPEPDQSIITVPEGAININEWEGPIYDSIEEAPYDAQSPIPYLYDLSLDGVLSIGWEGEMTQPSAKVLAQSIAIKDKDNKMRHKSSETVLLTNTTNQVTEEYILVDTMEVLLTDESSETEEQTRVKWSLLEFNEAYTKLKLQFVDADKFDNPAQNHTLSVTFLGVDAFKSKSGKGVRFGTELHWQVFRQVSKESQEQADALYFAFSIMTGVMLLTLPVCLLGKSLPVFMFFNSLQLIAHLPLLNSGMPGILQQFLRPYLDLVRLNIGGLSQKLDDSNNVSRQFSSGQDYPNFGQNNTILQTCGYSNQLSHNIFVILAIIGLLLACWLLAAFKDCAFCQLKKHLPRMLRPNHESFVANFATRFIYESYLELAICVLLSLNYEEKSSEMSGLQKIAVVVMLILLIAIPVFLVSKLRRNGPYIENYHTSLSLEVLCCWRYRSRNLSFNFKEYQSRLGKNEKKHDLQDLKVAVEQTNDNMFKRDENFFTSRPLLDSLSPIRLGPDHKRGTGVLDTIDPLQYESSKFRGRLETNEVNLSFERDNMNNGFKIEPVFQQLKEPIDPEIVGYPELTNETNQSVEVGHHRVNQILILSTIEMPYDSPSSLDFLEGGSAVVDHRQGQQRERARIDLAMESSVRVPFRYKTLYEGLKLNHARNAAVVHPLIFLLRRALLALIVIYLDKQVLTGPFLMLGSTIVVLAYACCEHQWKDKSINIQHKTNEIALYILGVLVLQFSMLDNNKVGITIVTQAFILLFLFWLATNLIFITMQSLIFVKYMMKRKYSLKSYKKLAKKVEKVTKVLKKDLNSDIEKQNETVTQGQLQFTEKKEEMEVIARRSTYGGFNSQILNHIQISIELDEDLPDSEAVSHFMRSAGHSIERAGRVVPLTGLQTESRDLSFETRNGHRRYQEDLKSSGSGTPPPLQDLSIIELNASSRSIVRTQSAGRRELLAESQKDFIGDGSKMNQQSQALNLHAIDEGSESYQSQSEDPHDCTPQKISTGVLTIEEEEVIPANSYPMSEIQSKSSLIDGLSFQYGSFVQPSSLIEEGSLQQNTELITEVNAVQQPIMVSQLTMIEQNSEVEFCTPKKESFMAIQRPSIMESQYETAKFYIESPQPPQQLQITEEQYDAQETTSIHIDMQQVQTPTATKSDQSSQKFHEFLNKSKISLNADAEVAADKSIQKLDEWINIDIENQIELRAVKSVISNQVVDKKPDILVEPATPVDNLDQHEHESNSNKTKFTKQYDKPDTQLQTIPQLQNMQSENNVFNNKSEGQQSKTARRNPRSDKALAMWQQERSHTHGKENLSTAYDKMGTNPFVQPSYSVTSNYAMAIQQSQRLQSKKFTIGDFKENVRVLSRDRSQLARNVAKTEHTIEEFRRMHRPTTLLVKQPILSPVNDQTAYFERSNHRSQMTSLAQNNRNPLIEFRESRHNIPSQADSTEINDLHLLRAKRRSTRANDFLMHSGDKKSLLSVEHKMQVDFQSHRMQQVNSRNSNQRVSQIQNSSLKLPGIDKTQEHQDGRNLSSNRIHAHANSVKQSLTQRRRNANYDIFSGQINMNLRRSATCASLINQTYKDVKSPIKNDKTPAILLQDNSTLRPPQRNPSQENFTKIMSPQSNSSGQHWQSQKICILNTEEIFGSRSRHFNINLPQIKLAKKHLVIQRI